MKLGEEAKSTTNHGNTYQYVPLHIFMSFCRQVIRYLLHYSSYFSSDVGVHRPSNTLQYRRVHVGII